jgi:hypothetical protein
MNKQAIAVLLVCLAGTAEAQGPPPLPGPPPFIPFIPQSAYQQPPGSQFGPDWWLRQSMINQDTLRLHAEENRARWEQMQREQLRREYQMQDVKRCDIVAQILGLPGNDCRR